MLFVCFNPTLQACTVQQKKKNFKAYTDLYSSYLSLMMAVGQCIIGSAGKAKSSVYEHFPEKLQCYCFLSLADLVPLRKDPRTFRLF